MKDRRLRARRKLLSLLGRSALEQISPRESPWHADRATLVEDALQYWDVDEVERVIARLLTEAE